MPYAINVECNKALNDEEKATAETDLLAAFRELVTTRGYDLRPDRIAECDAQQHELASART